MARTNKRILTEELMIKIESIHILTQEVMVACAFHKESLDKSLTKLDIEDSMESLISVENTLYILNGKLRKDA